jgi:hypothetical protein
MAAFFEVHVHGYPALKGAIPREPTYFIKLGSCSAQVFILKSLDRALLSSGDLSHQSVTLRYQLFRRDKTI